MVVDLYAPDLTLVTSREIPISQDDDRFKAYRGDAVMLGVRATAMVQATTQDDPGDVLQVFTQNAVVSGGRFCNQYLTRYALDLNDQLAIRSTDIMADPRTTVDAAKVEAAGLGAFTSYSATAGERKGFDDIRLSICLYSTCSDWGNTYYDIDFKKARGWVCAFPSDRLRPLYRVTVDGQTIDYPQIVSSEIEAPATTLVGVVFGPPPFSPVNTSADMQFGTEQKSGSKTATSTGGSVSAGYGAKFGGFGFEVQGTYGVETQTGAEKTTTATTNTTVTAQTKDAAESGTMFLMGAQYVALMYQRYLAKGQPSEQTAIPGAQILLTQAYGSGGTHLLPQSFGMIKPQSSNISHGIAAHASAWDLEAMGQHDPMRGATSCWTMIDNRTQRIKVTKTATSMNAKLSDSNATSTSKNEKYSVKADVKGWGLKTSASAAFSTTNTTTTSDSASVSGSLKLTPQGETPAQRSLDSLDVEVFWLAAQSPLAYWIPDWAKCGANDQRPWCVDYRVRSWSYYQKQAVAGAPEYEECVVTGIVRPAEAGEVRVGGEADETAYSATMTVGGGRTITATENDGYRFDHWQTQGEQIAVADPEASSTELTVSGNGGATVVAVYEPVVPSGVKVTPRSNGTCDIVMSGADLPDFLSSVPATTGDLKTHLVIGSTVCGLADHQWETTPTGATHTSAPWGKRSSCAIAINTRSQRWNLKATRVSDAGDFLRQCAAGQATLALVEDASAAAEAAMGQLRRTGVSVAMTSRATLAADTSLNPRLREGSASFTPAGIDMSKATVLVQTHKASAHDLFRVNGIRVPRTLLHRRGFVLDLNGERVRVGPFKQRNGMWRWEGRTPSLLKVRCAYTDRGRLAVTMTGRILRASLPTLVGHNLTLAITRGSATGEGNLITAVRSLTDERAVVPVTH